MSELSELAEDMLCSLAIQPCDLYDLIRRDFLAKLGGMDERTAWAFLLMKRKYWYEDRDGLIRVKKKYLEDAKNHIFK